MVFFPVLQGKDFDSDSGDEDQGDGCAKAECCMQLFIRVRFSDILRCPTLGMPTKLLPGTQPIGMRSLHLNTQSTPSGRCKTGCGVCMQHDALQGKHGHFLIFCSVQSAFFLFCTE